MNPGDLVTVDFDMAVISVHSNAPKTTFLTVDKDNCLRLSDGVLRKMFGNPVPTKYELIFHQGDRHTGPWIEIA